MGYFAQLRDMINTRLEDLATPRRFEQMNEFPWLYGALGEVPSDVMFIFGNPNVGGVERAQRDSVDGGPPNIESQWWGGATNFGATRFRVALNRLGLKTSPPNFKGGWRCYITNVIKEMNVVSEDRRIARKRTHARAWAPVLRWEIEHVRPRHVFCSGGEVFGLVSLLIKERRIPDVRPIQIVDYSARATNESVIEGIVGVVDAAIRTSQR